MDYPLPYGVAPPEIKSHFAAKGGRKKRLRKAGGDSLPERVEGRARGSFLLLFDLGRLDLDLDVTLFAHLDQVLGLVAVVLGHLVYALVLVRLAAILHLDAADLGLAVGNGPGDGDDERAFLMAGREAIVGAEHRGHNLVASGGSARGARLTAGGCEAA